MRPAPHIIVADDDPYALDLLRFAFAVKAPDVRLTFTGDGKMLLDYLQRKPPFEARPAVAPDFLFLDLKMPCIDGFQVLEFLVQHPLLRPEYIAVLSCSDLPVDRSRAAALGADYYFTKPSGFEELCRIAERTSAFLRTGLWQPGCPAAIPLRNQH